MWSQYGRTPVFAAAWNDTDKPECLEVLIAAKADLNITENFVSGRG